MTCGKRTRHTNRIGCCALCKELFSGETAFTKHRGSGPTCTEPADAGLVAKPSRTAAGEVVWSLPAGDNPWASRALRSDGGGRDESTCVACGSTIHAGQPRWEDPDLGDAHRGRHACEVAWEGER